MKNFKVVNNIELNRVVGGKIIRLTPYMLYNTKTHKTIPDYGAIWGKAGQTVANGWLQYGPWVSRG
ncbi:hypothetical protein [Lactobacillus crispatus]|uniref:hypothetical protein n=1 Tax=Lactobacillus crispatus TaxID=47770 RepID=UPI001C4DE098|nr:hypothetical protein [Lactobacillus crispatus]MBW0442815.1 hypothetical protein [Lactobacillus crispatus]MBW0458687.1 hypothetical protein [Lactobacillus crispatus]